LSYLVLRLEVDYKIKDAQLTDWYDFVKEFLDEPGLIVQLQRLRSQHSFQEVLPSMVEIHAQHVELAEHFLDVCISPDASRCVKQHLS